MISLRGIAVWGVLTAGLYGQATGDEFSVMVFTDVHAPDHTTQATAMADWITANYAAWNTKALVGVGDYRGTAVSNQCETVHWDSFISSFRSRLPALPSVWAVGNHDLCYANWDTYFGNLYPWNSAYPSAADPRNQYLALDVLAGGKTYKLGLMSLDLGVVMASGTQPRTWAQGIIDAGADRQFLVFPHIYLAGGVSGLQTGHPCASGAECSGGGDVGVQFEANFLVPNPRVMAAVSGHVSYYPAYYTTTTIGGTTTHSVGEDGASGGAVRVWILKFRPTAKKLNVGLYTETGGLYLNTVQTYDWEPAGGVRMFPLPGPVRR